MVYSMSSFIESSIKIRIIIMILMEICLILELIVIFSRIMRSAGKRKIINTVVEFIISFLFMSGLLNDYRHSQGEKIYKPMFHLYPAYILLSLVIILTVCLIWLIHEEIKEYHNSLSPWSVYEAMNNVPCGVCVSDPMGRIVLCNIKMQELSRMLTGNSLQDYGILHNIIINKASRQKKIARLSSDSNVFYFPDDSVWMFQEYELREPDLLGYVQTVAIDVSEIYYNSEKIRNNNEKLEILNRKLEEMYEKIGDEIREQETLAMKMQIHDSFGRSLLSIRRILEKKEEPENMQKQLDTLKQLVYILTSTTVEAVEDQYKDTEKQARELGISVQIQGSYPENLIYRRLTDRAIRECVTNCARHAHGTEVYVNIKKYGKEYHIRITNNGELPVKGAKEGGGLSALRKTVEAESCSMETVFEPAFCLRLIMPLKG